MVLRLSLTVLALVATSGLEDPTDPVGTPRSAHLHRAYVQGSSHQADELAETGWSAPILVGTHHKTGTVLLSKIFRVAAKYMGVPRLKEAQTTNRTQCGKYFVGKLPVVCIVEHVSARDVKAWTWRPNVPFIHAVREPMEMCISAYQYHLTGAEPWLLQPLKDLNNLTIQQYYKTLPPEQAVNFECKRMMFELVETALVYNATRNRPKTLTLRLEEFASNYDGTTRKMFSFLGGQSTHVETLVNASTMYDITRQKTGDPRHVSSTLEKAALRQYVQKDPLNGRLMNNLRDLMGYGGITAEGPKREELCTLIRQICSTTQVGFIHWCSYGRVHPGRLASLAECGDPTLTHSTRLKTAMASNRAMVDPSAPASAMEVPAAAAGSTKSKKKGSV